jgi:branched-chain amino acid transport system permease protein
MTLFLQQLINGIAAGSIYAVFAMGFGLVFATMNILNVAHGTYATWGAIIALWGFTTLGLPLPAALVVGIIGGGLLGVIVDQLAFEPLRRRGSSLLGPIITSIGFWIILGQAAIIATDARIRTFPRDALPLGTFEVGSLVIPYRQVITIVVAVIVLIGMYLLVEKTSVGARIRAVGWSAEGASLSGVNPRAVIISTAFVAAATASVAGILSGISTNNVSFTLGEGLLLKGFAAVIVGGFGDLRGAALGGYIIGISEVMTAQYISNSFRDFFTFGLLVVILVIRPQGILGNKIVTLRA